jgi:antirestriction protein ArdC
MQTRSIQFSDLLAEALREPGIISSAYSLFHSYSIGNAIAAWTQCLAREIKPGPIATFHRWKELGRYVRKGERALFLCMPVTCKREREGDDGAKVEDRFTRFVWRPNWFVLAQTDGTGEPAPIAAPGWSADAALSALTIERVPFEHMDGNCQGYARKRSVAVSPLAENPVKTMLHELAHVVLGHTEVSECSDAGELTRADREVEAEGCAYICGSILGLCGLEKSRGYLRAWLGEGSISERSAARIFKAADTILKAGRLTERGAS